MQIILNKLYGEDKSAKVGKILVKNGDTIQPGDGLFNAESTKGNFLVQSEYEGCISKLLIQEGQQIKIGAVIAEMDGKKVTQEPQSTGAAYSFGLAKPKKEDISCDIAVIGGGPGGYVAAIRGAQLGAKVVLIEKEHLGGTCLNSGCIPTKSFVKSAHLSDEIHHAAEVGLEVGPPVVHLDQIVKRKDEVVSNLSSGIQYLLKHWNIRLIQGEAVVSEQSIQVHSSKIDATIFPKKTILATGSSPTRLNIPGADLPVVLTNEEILNMKELPQALTIIGGGVIGMEFAFIFNSLGSKVSVIEYMDSILFNFDEDLVALIQEECAHRGITLHTGAKVEEISLAEDKQAVTAFTRKGKSHLVVGDTVLMSVGRTPNLSAVNLQELRVELNEKKNGIQVDHHMVTSNPSVYAIGDVTNIIQLAHVASHQGIVAAEHCMGQSSTMDYTAVPSAVFVSPEFATVGLCEKEAQKSAISYEVSKFPFSANGKALSQGQGHGFVKILFDTQNHCILGAAVIGPNATDLIACFTPLIQQKTDYRTLHHTIFAHPTTAESIHEAILGITGEAIHFA
ncbi:dihydrolipoyl dehydrogenase [Aminipila butyrica]|uniref:Dihydrolipoyl dehydrogenase n=1 Tax=Aminipila butyrica TaxID=433296 RepID=A0A858BYQ7_9FIRM|nr:dihydrolipoyl dehydrogenase [Aminipila butyrica]QIB69834.1 dihydrolipoyl dehydrogenase [Aminipila butyrica]